MPGAWIRGGVPTDFNLGGYDFDPAEGENINYMLSGRGGAVHIAGNGTTYKESNPLLGGFNQTFSVDEDSLANLVALQESSESVTGYFTMPSGETYNVSGGISNDGALENDNGTVSIEFRGTVTQQ